MQMPNIPVPCTNCLRFHYGPCWEAPKQCFQCGGFNHIERYCPRGRRIPTDRGGPLPGTLLWCEMNSLNDDPDLKRKVLDALKTSPGCSIWVNDRCIYQGNERHFNQDEPRQRGHRHPLADTIARARSRSPARERVWKRSPSLFQRYDGGGRLQSSTRNEQFRPRSYFQSCDDYLAYSNARLQSPGPYARYRSRTPIRLRSPSQYQYAPPQQRARSYASGSNAVEVEPRSNAMRATALNNESLQPKVPPPKMGTAQMPVLSVKGCASTTIQSSTAPAAALPTVHAQAPLGEVSANISRQTASALPNNVSQNTGGNAASVPANPKPMANNTIADTGVQRSQLPNENEPFVEDPYFVLGVSEGATETE